MLRINLEDARGNMHYAILNENRGDEVHSTYVWLSYLSGTQLINREDILAARKSLEEISGLTHAKSAKSV